MVEPEASFVTLNIENVFDDIVLENNLYNFLVEQLSSTHQNHVCIMPIVEPFGLKPWKKQKISKMMMEHTNLTPSKNLQHLF